MFYNSSKFLEQLLFFGKMPFFTPKRQFSQKLGFWCMFWQFSYNKSASNSQNIQLNCADLKNWARDLIFFVGDHHTQYNGKMHEMECKSKKVVFWATLILPVWYGKLLLLRQFFPPSLSYWLILLLCHTD